MSKNSTINFKGDNKEKIIEKAKEANAYLNSTEGKDKFNRAFKTVEKFTEELKVKRYFDVKKMTEEINL